MDAVNRWNENLTGMVFCCQALLTVDCWNPFQVILSIFRFDQAGGLSPQSWVVPLLTERDLDGKLHLVVVDVVYCPVKCQVLIQLELKIFSKCLLLKFSENVKETWDRCSRWQMLAKLCPSGWSLDQIPEQCIFFANPQPLSKFGSSVYLWSYPGVVGNTASACLRAKNCVQNLEKPKVNLSKKNWKNFLGICRSSITRRIKWEPELVWKVDANMTRFQFGFDASSGWCQ